MTQPLPPGIAATIDTALAGLEGKFSGVSTDPQIRSDVDAAVGAVLTSLDRVVPEATQTGTRQSIEGLDPAALAGVAEIEGQVAAATRQAMEQGPVAAATKQAMEEGVLAAATRREMNRRGRSSLVEAR